MHEVKQKKYAMTTLKAYMITEAICLLIEAADNLEREQVGLPKHAERIKKIIEELRVERNKD